MDSIGIAELVTRMEKLAHSYGDKYKPADILVKMKQENRTFY